MVAGLCQRFTNKPSLRSNSASWRLNEHVFAYKTNKKTSIVSAPSTNSNPNWYSWKINLPNTIAWNTDMKMIYMYHGTPYLWAYPQTLRHQHNNRFMVLITNSALPAMSLCLINDLMCLTKRSTERVICSWTCASGWSTSRITYPIKIILLSLIGPQTETILKVTSCW